MMTPEKQIEKLTKIGEFKTFGEAKLYCRLHGLDDSHVGNNAFQIAGALMDARKDQDKITRHACADAVTEIEYNSHAMGCGLEDISITDRYEAMEHGWNNAIDSAASEIINTEAV
jgi:hypothetical protein